MPQISYGAAVSNVRLGRILLLALLMSAVAGEASAGGTGGGMPWDNWLTSIADSITGPVAKAIGVIAIGVIAIAVTGLGVAIGGLAAVLAADRAELGRHVSQEGVLELKLVRETATRVALAALPCRCLLTSSGAVQAYLRSVMAGLPREEFWVLFLNRKNQLLVSERLGLGSVNHAPVYPREVLRRALEVGASAMILAHNHPSGDPAPSRPDLDITKAIVEGGRVLGVSVWDHMIVGRDRVLSLKAEGLM